MKKATIDLGSNMAQMLIRVDGNEYIFQSFTALGDGTATTKLLSDQSILRTIEVLKMFKRHLSQFGINSDEVVLCATAACRLATNREYFFERVLALGLHPALLTAEQEAYLASHAILSGQENITEFVALDIGGASTELVLLDEQKRISSFVSLNIGTLIASEYVKEGSYAPYYENLVQLNTSHLLSFVKKKMICTRGTMTTIFNIVLNNNNAIETDYHQKVLASENIINRLNEIKNYSEKDLKRLFPYIEPRMYTMPGAIELVLSLLKTLEIEQVTLSNRGLVHGAMELLFK